MRHGKKWKPRRKAVSKWKLGKRNWIPERKRKKQTGKNKLRDEDRKKRKIGID